MTYVSLIKLILVKVKIMSIIFVLIPALLFTMIFQNLNCKIFSVKKLFTIFVVMCFVVLFSVGVMLINPQLTYLIDVVGNFFIVICLAIFSYTNTKSLSLSVLLSLLTVIIAMVINNITFIPAQIILDITLEDSRGSIFLHIIGVILTFPLCYYTSLFIGRKLDNHLSSLVGEVSKKFILYSTVLAFVTYVFAQINIFVYLIVESYVILSSINVVILAFIFLTALIIMVSYSNSQQKQYDMEQEKKANKIISKNIKQIEANYEEMRSYRHDHRSILSTHLILLKNKNYKELEKSVKEGIDYADEILKKTDDTMSKLINVKLPQLKSLLAVRFAQALSKDVELTINIPEPVEDIGVINIELNRIVGIILDNALEELSLCKSPEKVLTFSMINETHATLISCGNTCTNQADVLKIYEKGFTTKENGSGLGLYNLKNLCKKNNILVSINAATDKFEIILMIRNV